MFSSTSDSAEQLASYPCATSESAWDWIEDRPLGLRLSSSSWVPSSKQVVLNSKELLVEVLRHLPPVQRAQTALVGRSWAAAAADPSLWKLLDVDGCLNTRFYGFLGKVQQGVHTLRLTWSADPGTPTSIHLDAAEAVSTACACMKLCPHLESLQLAQSYSHLVIVISALSRCPFRLSGLSLWVLEPAGFLELARHLFRPELAPLRHIQLCIKHPRTSIRIDEAVNGLSRLERLALQGSEFQVRWEGAIRLPALSHLDLGVGQCRGVWERLPALGALTSLTCAFLDEAAEIDTFIQAVPRCPALTSLQVDMGLLQMEVSFSVFTNLTRLHLSWDSVLFDDIMPNLSYLALVAENMVQLDMAAIAAMKHLRFLAVKAHRVKLKLPENEDGEEDDAAVAACASRLRQLQSRIEVSEVTAHPRLVTALVAANAFGLG